MTLTGTEIKKLDKLYNAITRKLKYEEELGEIYDLGYYLEQINLMRLGNTEFDENIVSDIEFLLQ